MVIEKELNTRCYRCKKQYTQVVEPKVPLACPGCGKPLCVEGFQEVEM